MPHQREIFIIEVEFEDIDGYKDRPVLILFQCDHLYTIVPITHVAPKNPPLNYFDEAKELIVNWKKYGLEDNRGLNAPIRKTMTVPFLLESNL